MKSAYLVAESVVENSEKQNRKKGKKPKKQKNKKHQKVKKQKNTENTEKQKNQKKQKKQKKQKPKTSLLLKEKRKEPAEMEKNMWEKPAKPKIKKAAAIRYDAKDVAPTVIAKGAGVVAENIIKVGEQEKIAIVENKELVEELSRIELGDNIPPELYQIVAEVLIFVSDLDELRAKTERL